ncbi:keratin, type I cytoskeletal 18-like [Scyliorhinus torazame]|uniref:keratin, type I cytoskeletal 18-like n=1 Tax=Scyliorhinus torazame TaxID=75743 RepID=UPI003B5AADAB
MAMPAQVQSTKATKDTQALTAAREELTGLRQQIQILETECNALHGSLAALQNCLDNTEARYIKEIRRQLGVISQLEVDLGSLRDSLTVQTQDYQALLNLKMKLEAGIQYYKSILEGGHQTRQSIEEERGAIVPLVTSGLSRALHGQ